MTLSCSAAPGTARARWPWKMMTSAQSCARPPRAHPRKRRSTRRTPWRLLAAVPKVSNRTSCSLLESARPCSRLGWPGRPSSCRSESPVMMRMRVGSGRGGEAEAPRGGRSCDVEVASASGSGSSICRTAGRSAESETRAALACISRRVSVSEGRSARRTGRSRRRRPRRLGDGRVGSLSSPGTPQVELGGVELAPGDRATDGQRQRGREGAAQRLVVEVLVHRVEGVALEQVHLSEVAVVLHRGVVLVVRQGRRLVADAPPEQVEPPAEVDVLVEHEDALVEAADLLEDLGPDEQGGAGAEEDVPRPRRGSPSSGSVVRLVAHAEPGDGGVDEVDRRCRPSRAPCEATAPMSGLS